MVSGLKWQINIGISQYHLEAIRILGCSFVHKWIIISGFYSWCSLCVWFTSKHQGLFTLLSIQPLYRHGLILRRWFYICLLWDKAVHFGVHEMRGNVMANFIISVSPPGFIFQLKKTAYYVILNYCGLWNNCCRECLWEGNGSIGIIKNYSYCTAWSLSQKERNRLVHALNGNTTSRTDSKIKSGKGVKDFATSSFKVADLSKITRALAKLCYPSRIEWSTKKHCDRYDGVAPGWTTL